MSVRGVTTAAAFDERKRNLLVASAIGVVIRMASPSKEIKIPGLGTEVSIASGTAYLFLALAIAYFLAQFYLALQVTISTNSALLERGSSFGEIQERINEDKQAIDVHYQSIASAVRYIEVGEIQGLSGERDLFEDDLRNRFSEMREEIKQATLNWSQPVIIDGVQHLGPEGIVPLIGEKIEGSYANMIDFKKYHTARLIDAQTKIHDQLSGVKTALEKAKAAADEAAVVQRRMERRLRQLSGNINIIQRFGFRALDQWMPIAFAVSSIALCVSGTYQALHHPIKITINKGGSVAK